MKFLRTRRGRVIAGIVLIGVLFLARPGAQRLRTRIVRSISLALGRQVDVGSVTLRLLPRPGFELKDFVVHDDPAFGAEPVLQSSDVVALVRLTSLLRGRLEIARLSLTEPSLNLMRNPAGHWNLENLLERAANTPVAPTAKARNEARPGFPYIEADHGRINFKLGQEKKPYSLTDASFALWQDSENAWGVRLKAQPTRTDFNLSDTGLVEVDGSWQRAANLHDTPLQFQAQWEGAQLGQVTKLTLGQDKGWRGSIRVTASFSGTPQNLSVAADTSIEDFRRYDISGGKAMRLAAHCSANYSSSNSVISQLACRAPVADGEIALDGRVVVVPAFPDYDLILRVQSVPVQPLVDFARRVKKNLPADLIAAGKMNAEVTLRRSVAAGPPLWHGGGALSALSVRSSAMNSRLALERIPFVISSISDAVPNGPRQDPLRKSEARPQRIPGDHTLFAMQPQVLIGPFALPLGKPNNAIVRGQFSRSGYSLAIQGDAELPRLLDVARMAGLPAPQLSATGGIHVDLHVGGSWTDFAAPLVTGTAELNSVDARLRGLNEPVEIASATLSVLPDATEVHKLVAVAAGNSWRGSLTVPRHCVTPRSCVIRFDLRTDEVSTDVLGAAFAVSAKQPWYRFLSSAGDSSQSQAKPYLAMVHAIGRISASRVLLHTVLATHVSADADLQQGQLRLTNLQGEILGGKHTGEWTADFTSSPPTYSGNGMLENVALEHVARAMHDDWITGTASAHYRATTAGRTRAELLAGATASFQIDARNGSLPHLVLAGESAPLLMSQFTGRLSLHDGKIEIEGGKLQTPANIYQLSGTASLDRVLDMKLAREGSRSFNITGTLTQPHVVINTSPETQAALKP